MVTWTTYGTWIRGDKRGWRENGKIYEPNPHLKQIDESQMKGNIVRLNSKEKTVVKEAICKEGRINADRLANHTLRN